MRTRNCESIRPFLTNPPDESLQLIPLVSISIVSIKFRPCSVRAIGIPARLRRRTLGGCPIREPPPTPATAQVILTALADLLFRISLGGVLSPPTLSLLRISTPKTGRGFLPIQLRSRIYFCVSVSHYLRIPHSASPY